MFGKSGFADSLCTLSFPVSGLKPNPATSARIKSCDVLPRREGQLSIIAVISSLSFRERVGHDSGGLSSM